MGARGQDRLTKSTVDLSAGNIRNRQIRHIASGVCGVTAPKFVFPQQKLTNTILQLILTVVHKDRILGYIISDRPNNFIEC